MRVTCGERQGAEEEPFGLKCEAPHTYLTEQDTTVSVRSKGSRGIGTDLKNITKKRFPVQEEIVPDGTEKESAGAEEGNVTLKQLKRTSKETNTQTRKMLSMEMYPRIGDCFYRDRPAPAHMPMFPPAACDMAAKALPQRMLPPPPNDPTTKTPKDQVKMELENASLWKQFTTVGTEMIITKKGRRMFPGLRLKLSGLNPSLRYLVLLDIVPLDNSRYRFQGCWRGRGQAAGPGLHPPDSPATGAHWQSRAISFHHAKLTNNTLDSQGHIILHSLHRYQPRIHVIEARDVLRWGGGQHSFVFPETQFLTVTAYQNNKPQQMTSATDLQALALASLPPMPNPSCGFRPEEAPYQASLVQEQPLDLGQAFIASHMSDIGISMANGMQDMPGNTQAYTSNFPAVQANSSFPLAPLPQSSFLPVPDSSDTSNPQTIDYTPILSSSPTLSSSSNTPLLQQTTFTFPTPPPSNSSSPQPLLSSSPSYHTMPETISPHTPADASFPAPPCQSGLQDQISAHSLLNDQPLQGDSISSATPSMPPTAYPQTWPIPPTPRTLKLILVVSHNSILLPTIARRWYGTTRLSCLSWIHHFPPISPPPTLPSRSILPFRHTLFGSVRTPPSLTLPFRHLYRQHQHGHAHPQGSYLDMSNRAVY
ncbi:hypothetical protein F7725_014237 [Dissostichus mawsoni]|uniref:T-box domain-containing protein n=1 Tax=Dissostichus mawsoni TaxID=36200 RepID=A0A7J5YXT3_DISMA|nr:hypothetical protein F7725_014237 [Dissostichus mawsoni]